MSILALPHLPPFALALASGTRALRACVCRSRLAAVVLSRGSRVVPVVPCAALVLRCLLAPQFFAFCRPLSLGRVGGVGLSRRSRSVARRGSRRLLSALAPAAVACGGGALLETPVQSAFPGGLVGAKWRSAVTFNRGPTHHSSGPARKAAQAAQFKR
jgi:hypothetical protein